MPTPQTPGQALKAKLKAGRCIAAGAFVPFVARLAEEAGYDAIYVSGHGNPKFGITLQRDELLVFRDYLGALLAATEAGLKAGKTKEEIQKMDNLEASPISTCRRAAATACRATSARPATS